MAYHTTCEYKPEFCSISHKDLVILCHLFVFTNNFKSFARTCGPVLLLLFYVGRNVTLLGVVQCEVFICSRNSFLQVGSKHSLSAVRSLYVNLNRH